MLLMKKIRERLGLCSYFDGRLHRQHLRAWVVDSPYPTFVDVTKSSLKRCGEVTFNVHRIGGIERHAKDRKCFREFPAKFSSFKENNFLDFFVFTF